MPEVVSCAAPLSYPSPSCEAGLLPPSIQVEKTSVKAGPEPLQPLTLEEKGEMQAKLITDTHASTMFGCAISIIAY